jgi:hypothetical protein
MEPDRPLSLSPDQRVLLFARLCYYYFPSLISVSPLDDSKQLQQKRRDQASQLVHMTLLIYGGLCSVPGVFAQVLPLMLSREARTADDVYVS